MSWVAVAIGGGALISGIGGGISGNQGRQAAARADDDQVLRLRSQQGVMGNSVLGSGYGALPLWQQIYGMGIERQDQNLINQGLQGINAATQSFGGSVLDQQRNLANTVSTRQTGNLDYFDRDTARLAGIAGGDRNDLMNSARGMENMASTWGSGMSQRINRDAGRDLSRANQMSDRTLSSRGLGNSSMLVGAQQANRRNIGESRDNALLNLGMAQTDRQMGARQNALGIQERTGQAQIGREYQRAADRGGLEERNLTRDIGLRQDPINTLMQTLGGSVMNPYLGYQVGSPGAGGSGAAIGAIGNSLTSSGNYMSNQNFLEMLMRQRGNT